MRNREARVRTGVGALPGCRTKVRHVVPLLLLLWLVLPGAGPCLAGSSVNVPIGHWSYDAVEKLSGFGLIQTDIQGMRPFTRLEMARLVVEATQQRELSKARDISPLADALLAKLQKHFGSEIPEVKKVVGTDGETFFKPIESAEVRYVYSQGTPHRFLGFPESGQSIDGTEGTPLVYNNDGVVYGKGSNATVQFASSLRLGGVFSASVEPIFIARSSTVSLVGADSVDVELLKGYGKISPDNFEIEVGRDSLWWGQGRHGSLLLTNNAEPLDMVKISNPSPTMLPWIFSYLGILKYSVFCAMMEDDFNPSHPLFAGARVNFKPTWWLELGYGTTFLFGGSGVPKPSVLGFLGLLTGVSFGQANKVDQIAMLDARITLPFLRNAELYLEYGGEDSGGFEYPEEWLGLGDVGTLVGLYFPRLTADGKMDLRIEFAQNAHRKDDTPGFWYGHNIYRSGYTHNHMIMGHHMGGDAMDAFVRVTRYFRPDLRIGIDYDLMERGVTLSDVQETSNQVGLDATYDFNGFMSIGGRYAIERVENFDLELDDNRTNQLFMGVIKFEF